MMTSTSTLNSWTPAVLGLLALGLTLAPAAAPDARAITQANNAFATDLYGKLKAADGNLFFSPFSIHAAFGMAGSGARGNTAIQMAQVLHFDGSPAEPAPGLGALQQLLNDVQSKGKVELAIANSIWPERSYPFRKDYLSLLHKHFKVSVSPCDFKGKVLIGIEPDNAGVGHDGRVLRRPGGFLRHVGA